MKTLKLFLICGMLFSLASNASAVTFVDDFETAHDYLADGVAGTDWDGVIYNGGISATQDASVSNIEAVDGALFLASSNGSWEGADDDGVFLYKTIEAGTDFVADTYINDYSWVNYHAIILMARSAEPDTRDYVYQRHFQEWVGNGIVSTTDGASDVISFGTAGSPKPYLRLEKKGSTFTTSASDDGITYDISYTVDRPDLAGVDLQIGLGQATYTAEEGEAYFDYFTLKTPDVIIEPADGEINVDIEQDITWEFKNANIEKFDFYFGDEDEPNIYEKPEFLLMAEEPITTVTYEPGTLEYDTEYYYRIDTYEPNTAAGATDYFKTVGEVMSFTTAPSTPVFIDITPDFAAAAADGSGDVAITVEFRNPDTYQWYKEGEAAPLADGAMYSGVTTDTLTVVDVELADEGLYYCICTNYAGSTPSDPARVMIERMTSYFDMEAIVTGDETDPIVEDSLDGYDITLQLGTDEATYASISEGFAGDGALMFDKPSGHFALIEEGAVDYEDLTIVMWVLRGTTGTWERILDFGTGDSAEPYMFITASDGDSVRFAISDGGGTGEQVVEATEACAVDQWTYVAVTLDGDTARVYINGEMQGINTAASHNPIDQGFTYNLIADAQYTADPFFGGAIDELKIYNYALDSEEIANDFLSYGTQPWVCNYEGAMSISYDLDGDCEVTLVEFSYIAAEWLNSNRVYAGE